MAWIRKYWLITTFAFLASQTAAYATIDNLGQLSKTAASNTDFDSVSIAEGMAPSAVNNAMRALGALIAEHLDDLQGTTTGGTGAAYTLTTNSSYGALADIHALVIDFHTANTSTTPTLAVDGLSATTITDKDGGALAVGEVDGYNLVIYDGTDFQVVGNVDLSGISNVVEDTTPQLGGQLDVNGNAIGDGTRELLTFTEDGSAVNHVSIENEATGSGPIISAAGDDTNVALNIQSKAAGNIVLEPNTGDVSVADDVLLIEDDIRHAGDTNNLWSLGTDTQDFQTGGSSRLDLSDSGVRLGGANARVTTVLDEDAMGSDSATALATQQSIKAYSDNKRQLGTVDTLSGTTSDFTAPSGTVQGFVVTFAGMSTNGTSVPLLQIGDSGGVENSGYTGTAGIITNSSRATNLYGGTGVRLSTTWADTAALTGRIEARRHTGNTWVFSMTAGRTDLAVMHWTGGSKALSPGALTTVRLTTTNGTDTFDAGTMNVEWLF